MPKKRPFYYIHPAIDPAIDLWENPKAMKCMHKMAAKAQKEGEDIDDWELYNRACIECEEHDVCFEICSRS